MSLCHFKISSACQKSTTVRFSLLSVFGYHYFKLYEEDFFLLNLNLAIYFLFLNAYMFCAYWNHLNDFKVLDPTAYAFYGTNIVLEICSDLSMKLV